MNIYVDVIIKERYESQQHGKFSSCGYTKWQLFPFFDLLNMICTCWNQKKFIEIEKVDKHRCAVMDIWILQTNDNKNDRQDVNVLLDWLATSYVKCMTMFVGEHSTWSKMNAVAFLFVNMIRVINNSTVFTREQFVLQCFSMTKIWTWVNEYKNMYVGLLTKHHK